MGPRIYGWLVRLLPADVRKEYADELRRVVGEKWVDRDVRRGWVAGTAYWMRESWALVHLAADARREGRHLTGGMTMDGWWQDLREAVRGLTNRPGFAALTVLTLGMGIGATAAIFSAVHTVLLRPLPYDEPDRVVVLFDRDVVDGTRRPGVSAANIRDFGESATLFEAVAVAEPWSLDLQLEDRTESLRTWAVGPGFFDAIGAEAEFLGRAFTEADYRREGGSVVLVSHRSWVTRFGADPSIVGRTLTLSGEGLTVVGVLPAGFRFPDAAEMWVPRPEQPRDERDRAADYLTGVARLAEGASLTQARAEADRIAAGLREAYPRLNSDLAFDVVPLREHLFGSADTTLRALMVAVGLLLLIACANVAGLMLARGAQRERDYALRGALGAGTGRLVSHVTAESLLIAIAGGAVGIALAYAGVQAIRALAPGNMPRFDELAVDGSVLAFAVGASILSALLSSLAPSLRFARPDLRGVLGDGSRGSSGGPGRTRSRARLVVLQVACAVVLLFGAGLLIRSFATLLDRDLGFDPTDRVAVQLFAYDYANEGEREAFLDAVSSRMRALPGVSDVARTTSLPAANDAVISSIDILVPFEIEGRVAPTEDLEPQASVVHVGAGYFGAMGIDVVSGRDFSGADNPDASPVIIVNEAFARENFPDDHALGARVLVRYADANHRPVWRDIVGVVGDTRPFGHASDPRPELYFPLSQFGAGSITFVLKTTVDPRTVMRPAVEAVWEANPAQAVWGAVTVEDLVGVWLAERRFILMMLTAFAAMALTLSAVGLYGIVSFTVEHRRGEIGIRRALGGRSQDLVAMVLAEGTRLAGIGLALGLGASWYLSRFIRGLLFGVEPGDPLTLGGLAVLVGLIAVLASGVPALRATRVEPATALRGE